MQDLSSLSDALHDILKADGAGGEGFTRLIQANLESPDPAIRQLTLEILLEVVTEGEDDCLASRRAFIFGETVLTYLPLLLPLRSAAASTVDSLLRICLENCSSREAILALNEACQLLEEKAERCEVSDDGMDEASAFADGDEQDEGELADQFNAVLASYAIVFSRMQAIRSTPTLLTVSDAITSSLPIFVGSLVATQATNMLRAASELVQAAWDWVCRSTDQGGEQRAILTQLLHLVLTLLVPAARLNMLHSWFTSHFPRYSLLTQPHGASQTESPMGKLEGIISATQALGVDASSPVACLSRNISPPSPYAPLASLHLLAYRIITHASSKPVELPGLEQMLIPLSAGLSGSATDSAAVILWEAVRRCHPGKIALDTAMPLIELLMPLATSDPDATCRLAYFKLIQGLVEKVPPGTDQVLLLRQLLEPANPYDTLRPQALSIVRELATRAVSTSISPNATAGHNPVTTILQPALLSELPLLPWKEHLALPTSDFLDNPVVTFVTDQLMTLRLLYELDKEDQTGIRGEEYRSHIRAAVVDIRAKIALLKAEKQLSTDQGDTYDFVVSRLQDAAERLDLSVKGR